MLHYFDVPLFIVPLFNVLLFNVLLFNVLLYDNGLVAAALFNIALQYCCTI